MFRLWLFRYRHPGAIDGAATAAIAGRSRGSRSCALAMPMCCRARRKRLGLNWSGAFRALSFDEPSDLAVLTGCENHGLRPHYSAPCVLG
jgi:hypothetical protein